MKRLQRPRRAVLLCLLATLGTAHAAVPVERVHIDLRPLIRRASAAPAQFAVSVPHKVSAAGGGRWTQAHGEAVWRYAVEVPTAVSLSFHAAPVALPAHAHLVVRGERTTASYGPQSLHRGELWSRVQPGAALEFTLTVPTTERAQVRFSLVSLQAGYRSLGAGVADHPYYRQIKAATAASGNGTCITNYECKATAANAPSAAATIALLVQNQFECTGTLINDVPGDNTPYVLTARHCISGKVGPDVDDPVTAAQQTSVYWDAVTPCGQALGSIYDPNIPIQTGATSLVEQQDAWLIRLDVNPVVADAQFAGFDASGATFSGGYTVHHAQGNDKQFTGWFGQPAKVSVAGILSPFLETVNQVGNIAPGASGSALFDPSGRLVGSLTYGRNDADASGYQSCPAATPPAPDGSNGVADFTALAAVWNSSADTSSSTGPVTLKSVLDPHDTGTLVTSSAPVASVSFNASNTVLVYGTPLELTWAASGATGCTAGGGLPGDTWGGALASSGSQSLTESSASAPVTYTLLCSYAGGRTANASVTVTWAGPTPQLSLTATPDAAWTTRPVTLSWTSNVTPCAVSGGGLALTNLPASGTTTATSAAVADVIYTLSCGPAGDSGASAVLVQYAAPSVTLEANGTDRRIGEQFLLYWQSFADTCTTQGGASGDGWAGNSFASGSAVAQFAPLVTAAGTYTYTVSCSSGALTAQQSVSVTFENSAPYVTAALDHATVAFTDSPADYATLSLTSNLSTCSSLATPNTLAASTGDPLGLNSLPQSSQTLSPQRSGVYTLTVTCTAFDASSSVSSTPLTLTVTPAPAPTAAITLTPATVVSGETFTVAWTSLNAGYCLRSGGLPGDAWNDPTGPPAGYVTDTGAAGTFEFTLSCYSIDAANAQPVTVKRSLTIEALAANLSVSPTSVHVGDSFTLTWSATGAGSCTASGGGADGSPWSGTVDASGSLSQKATTAGTFTYALQCSAGGQVVNGQAVLTVSAASGGGGGGGGDLGFAEIAALALWALVRRRRVGAAALR